MGQRVYIKIKDTIDPVKMNEILTNMKIENEFTTAQQNIDWLKDINTNSKSPQAHLKPKDGNLRMEELQAMFPTNTEVGLLSFDVAFTRTTEEQAQLYLQFIEKYRDDIEYLRGADSLIDKFDVKAKHIKIIAALDKPEPDPVKLPKDQQTKHDLQSGLFLCKSWSAEPFWVLFGKVDSPVFMKDRVYEEDIYNNLYRDKKGRAFMLLPLMPLDNKQVEFATKVYNEAIEIGLRENFNFIIPLVYGLDVVSYSEVAEDFRKFYTQDELVERFKKVYDYTTAVFPYNCPGGFVWSDVKKRFKPCANETTLMNSRCSILTCLVWAMGKDKAAEVMTAYTGKKYLPFEFDIKTLKAL